MSDESQQPGAAGDNAPDDTYEPSTVQATRERMQGLGVGAKDIAYQRDPTRGDSTNHYGAVPDGDAQELIPGGPATPATDSQAGPPGQPSEAYDKRDADQVDTDWPAG